MCLRWETEDIEVDIPGETAGGSMQFFENFKDCSVNSQEYIRPVLFGAGAKKDCFFSTAMIKNLLENGLFPSDDPLAGNGDLQ